VQRAEAMEVAATPKVPSGLAPLLTLLRRGRVILGPEVKPAGAITYTPQLVAYVGGTAVFSAAIALVSVRAPGDLAGVLIVSIAIWLMSFFSVLSVSGVNTAFNASSFLHLGMALSVGPAGAFAGAVAESSAILVRYRTGTFRLAFNFSELFLADVAAWAAFHGLESLWPHGGPLYIGLVGMVTGFVNWAVNYSILSGTLAIATRRSYFRQIRDAVAVSPYNLCYGYAAIGFVALHDQYGPLGFTFALAPVLALQIFLVVLARRTQQHERQRDLLLDKIKDESLRVERSYDATLIALTHALDARDKETEGHSRRVVEYTRLVAVRLGIEGEALKLLCHGALLHDIGKIGVPDAILHKPGPLTEAEWQVMRRHPEIGALMVEEVEYLKEARRIILHHHERWDGRGYPLGLRGTQISAGARAFAIADTIDAITQDRPYRRGRSFDEAREELVRHRGTQFDPEAVDAFLEIAETDLMSISAIRARVGIDLLAGRSAAEASPTARLLQTAAR
jgi:putative nucleotidyltransferase with HDIG domain